MKVSVVFSLISNGALNLRSKDTYLELESPALIGWFYCHLHPLRTDVQLIKASQANDWICLFLGTKSVASSQI